MGVLRIITILFLLGFAGVIAMPEGHAETQSFNEYRVKSVFLLNLSKFVNWPAQSFSGPNATFRIVILGEDPFGPVLDKVIKGESVQGHPIVIERLQNFEGLQPCHIVFISPSMKRKLPDILEFTRTTHILTVSDYAGFCRQGGMINLPYKNNRVQIEANVKAAERAGLQISSKLLRLAVPF